MFQKISNLFGIAPMYVPCKDSGFISGPKYICEYNTSFTCTGKTEVKYTYDTRNGERCSESKVRCC